MRIDPIILLVKGVYSESLLIASLSSLVRAMWIVALCLASSMYCVSSLEGGGSGSIDMIMLLCCGGGGSGSMLV